ncbi:uracil permease [Exophiala dermatitidis]|uniref:NCS1 family nucleobase:cation symporter-1 n=2 Tax=Exophiala dermatitidis TaxID=5970 RepID=H6BPM1_EXODN|nr:NCS1 family nucleobase:cation symporter-1 [Exophiala dermatitidis NIH/UT8656]KAJ4518872.1 uracil permease [Exophiala dermatitidis]EHY53623.1 NCS1 family nucleobase:cation symporter-1 [Exophiala dermatitidis NIH/UT8656]KAJ4522197.1 uracil permease [Exophiala dermatitidis]KAJ4529523.1 uracil permease [Exophiala dermatitidis]KAJ4543816.1 uracil permease [Exophiala dermatitidis]
MARFRNTKAADVLSKLATSQEPGLTSAQLMLINEDLKPVEPERRQWGPWNFVGFWIADSFNINTWMIASSSIVGGGLAWWQAWLCVWIGYFIAAVFICLTGRIGAVYHISFPVMSRASFGIWGSLWPVFNRAGMACVWYGVQSWIGGQCVTLMIRAIWPSFYTLHNGIPGSGTTTRDFVGFFIFWVGSLPAIYFPVHKIRHLFTVKAYFVPCAGMAFFGWAIARAHGIGPIVHQPATSTGSKLAWGWISGIMSSIANFATLIVNDSDFTRFANRPVAALWSQLFTIPIGFAVTSFIGIIVSSSSTVIYGNAIWNPLDLLSQFLLDDATGAERFGVFVIAAAFVLAQLGTNIAANSVSAGTDMTALLPRYINIRRGGYICAIIGLCMCPWNLLSSSNNFTTYLSAYSVFLSSIAGVILCDYYIVRKGYLDLKGLYQAHHASPYYYWMGWSWRGYVAYICGIAINVVGFVDAIGTEGPMPMGAVYIYRFNFFCGLIVSMAVYYLLCWWKPIPATSTVWCEKPDAADRQFSVVYDGEGYDEERSIGSVDVDDGTGVGGHAQHGRPEFGPEFAQPDEKKTVYKDKAHEADF